ncbi:hypothetical protein A3860_17470 [Niastella vici]|uniref:Uncharacterized protein n=2 Tax=Niastella vici TaxID=1703345 RepID=A0A1V9G4H9_9BACT|nr:DUF3150 domain-containing protein [Niastella vici]OQP65454.1 hypothetical protein A3860_17470 [Niastella vici]
MKDLSKKVIVFNLTIKMWSAKKMDKKVTKEVEENHNAKDAGRFNKILIAKDGLSKLNSIAKEARDYHYEQTLPWTDNGGRILPATNYYEYINKQMEFKEKFEKAVDDFIAVYPALKADAQLFLNTMFSEADYPSVSKLREKFDFTTEPTPIAQLDDIRISVSQQEVDRLKQEVEKNIYKKIADSTKDMWNRIREAVEHMYQRLSDKDAKFKKSLVENVRDLVDLLPRLNFTDDPDINDAIDDMKKLLIDPDELRTNQIRRNETARNAKELLNKISDFVSDDILNFQAA